MRTDWRCKLNNFEVFTGNYLPVFYYTYFNWIISATELDSNESLVRSNSYFSSWIQLHKISYHLVSRDTCWYLVSGSNNIGPQQMTIH